MTAPHYGDGGEGTIVTDTATLTGQAGPSEIDALRAQVARLQADLDAAQALSAQGATMAASMADRYEALRLAAEAYLDARDAIDPPRETATRRQLEAVLGRPSRSASEGGGLGCGGVTIIKAKPLVSAARRMGLGGGSGTRGEEG